MEEGNDGTSTTNISRIKLQSMEDFMKEQDELNAQKASDAAAHLAVNPTKKQKTASLQAERELLEAQRKPKKTALEAEKKSVEKKENEAVKELGAENWIGKLLEYRNAHPIPTGGLVYAEKVVAQVPTRFTCTVVIHESSQHFGGAISFSNKKDAKKYASKKAVNWLIDNKHMPDDGSVKFPRISPPPIVKAKGPVAALSLTASPKPATTSYAGQIPELCIRLGFNTPTYEITKHSENTPLWNGYAHFGGDPRIEGKVGEVKSVYGKSNAKEQIAMEVLSFLKDIERQRMEMEDDDDEERKRKRSSVGSDLGESSGKVVKVAA